MPRERGDRAELDSALQPFYALPLRDQLRFHQEISSFLGAELRGETDEQRLTRERAEALDAMRRVAQHLSLGDDRAPRVQEFTAAARELGLEWTVARITRIFGRYSFAQDVLLGRWTPTTRRQREIQRASRHRKRSHEDYIAGLRAWLKSNPGEETKPAYDEFVEQYNERLAEDELPLAKTAALEHGLGLDLRTLITIARGELSVRDAQRRHVQEGLGSKGEDAFVSRSWIVARLGGGTEINHLISRHGFPANVAKAGSQRLWRAGDVLAWERGEAVPTRQAGEMQDQIVTLADVAAALGIKPESFYAMVYRKSLTPPPSHGHNGYWWRDEIKPWLEAEIQRRRASPRVKKQPPASDPAAG